ncbi:MAG: histidine kinase [Chitinophagaceae bacterium]|nr:histidine kinase [Chitinophagaceae bacterium]
MSSTPLSMIRFRLIFSLCWIIFMVDHALVLHMFGLPWKEAITDSVVSNILLLLPCLLIMNTVQYYMPQTDRYFNIFACCLALALVTTGLIKFSLKLTLDYYESFEPLLNRSLPIRFSIVFLLLGCITMISVLWYNVEEQKENELRKSGSEKLAREAELFKLRQQLHPHFLFNSLNSINALIGSRPAEARKMVQQLSDFLRGTLKKEDAQRVSLEEELQHLQLYLDIEKLRFGNRLVTNICKDDTAGSLFLPALLLQPIVENAIKFGLYDTIGETVISIKTYQEKNELVVEVSNPFDPSTSPALHGTGFGLSSVQRRLYLLFARNDLLSTSAIENMFTTQLKIPQAVLG